MEGMKPVEESILKIFWGTGHTNNEFDWNKKEPDLSDSSADILLL
jgi:hypothetical protein